MAGRTLLTYFTLQSPWSYLGHAPLREVGARHGARILYKPMNLLAVFPESGGLPLAKRHPHRRAYRDIELLRWREKRGIPLNLRPAFWPVDINFADRIIIALNMAGQDPERFIADAFAALWANEENLADETVVVGLLDQGHFASRAVIETARSSAAADAYEANTREALASGVFGAPTTILDGEPFWGQDRVELLDEALASGRPALALQDLGR